MRKIVVIVGPTASGKSDLAVHVAQKCNGEVISADSRQVYRGLNVGTGKITPEEMQRIPHHLLDIVDPGTVFSAHDFVLAGRRAIEDIASRGRIPIVAGGTAFYIDALIGAISLPSQKPNEELRALLEKRSTEELLLEIEDKDPRRASMLTRHDERNNKRRLIRTLEVIDAQGVVPLAKGTPLYDVLWIGIDVPRPLLRERIHARLLSRMQDGMLEEARVLHESGVTYERMDDLGLEYRYLAKVLQGEVAVEDMIPALEAKIWRYAKRQCMYWSRNKKINWFTREPFDAITPLVKTFLKENRDENLPLSA